MPEHEQHPHPFPAVDPARVSRRTLLGTSAAAAILPAAHGRQAAAGSTESGVLTPVVLTVNGHEHRLSVDSRASLLDVLRERLQLTGTKKGCDHGQCGACTVEIDGRTVVACLTLIAKADGAKVTTVEGLARGEVLHPMQQAFIDHDALQCGYCTPGQLMSAVACVRLRQSGSRETIREFMSGNLCRCGAYNGIVGAIESVAATSRRG